MRLTYLAVPEVGASSTFTKRVMKSPPIDFLQQCLSSVHNTKKKKQIVISLFSSSYEQIRREVFISTRCYLISRTNHGCPAYALCLSDRESARQESPLIEECGPIDTITESGHLLETHPTNR